MTIVSIPISCVQIVYKTFHPTLLFRFATSAEGPNADFLVALRDDPGFVIYEDAQIVFGNGGRKKEVDSNV